MHQFQLHLSLQQQGRDRLHGGRGHDTFVLGCEVELCLNLRGLIDLLVHFDATQRDLILQLGIIVHKRDAVSLFQHQIFQCRSRLILRQDLIAQRQSVDEISVFLDIFVIGNHK